MNTQHTEPKKEKWDIASGIIDKLQVHLEDDEITREELVKYLANIFPPDFPVENCNMSVVYWVYHTDKFKVLIEGGKSKEDLYLETSPLLMGGTASIKSVIYGESMVLENTIDKCQQHGFLNCGSLIIVPMRVDIRIIGAFILQVKAENRFDVSDQRVMDRISDRLALFIHFIDQKRRSEIKDSFFNHTIDMVGSYEREEDILQTAFDHLVTDDWFSPEEISIVLSHPFDQGQLYLACEDGKISDDIRKNGKRTSELTALLGDLPNNLLGSQETVSCNTPDEISKYQLPKGYHSYVFVPMRIRKNKRIGYFILRNTHQDYAYKDELNLLGRFANFTALRLRNFRRDQANKELQNFRINYIRDNKAPSDQDIYEAAVKAIESIYGEVSLSVINIQRDTLLPIVEYQHRKGETLKDFKPTISQNTVTKNFVPAITEKIKDDKSISAIKGCGKLFTVHAESGLVTKLVIIEASRDLPNNLIDFTKELLSLIEFKQSLKRKKKRLQALTDFGKAVTQQENLTQEDVYKLTYEYTREVMAVANMYIALLDPQTQEISFPCFYRQNGDDRAVSRITVPPRSFDKISDKMGRTEVILATGDPILIKTKEESEAWYRVSGREEKIGNSFASWIGVPIVSKNQNIGVIALYHPTIDYLYHEGDITFLENMATHVSDLLNRFELEKSRLNILLQESRVLKASFAKDIIHKQHNTIGGTLSQIKIANTIIERSIQQIDVSNLEIAHKNLDSAVKGLKSYLKEIESVDAPIRESFSVLEVIKIHLANIKAEKMLSTVEMIVERDAPDVELFSYKGIVDSLLHSLINNAGEAISDASITQPNKGFYIHINTFFESDFFVVEIKDNAPPIEKSILVKLFKSSISTKNSENRGYGLIRAKEILTGLRGRIELYKNDGNEKIFRIRFPLEKNNEKNALVVDNEEMWRDILSYYMQNLGFRVSQADGRESAESVLERMRGELSVVLLDLSFDEKKAGDVQGLVLINKIKETNPNAKIIVVSGYPEKADKYKEYICKVINKVDGGDSLGEEEFTKQIKELGLL